MRLFADTLAGRIPAVCLVLSMLQQPGLLPVAAASSWFSKRDPAVERLTEQERAMQALNRLTFGPRPGDLQRVQAMGVNK